MKYKALYSYIKHLVLISFCNICLTVAGSGLLHAQSINKTEDNKFPRRFIAGSSNNFPPMNMLDGKGNLIGFGKELSDAVIMSIEGKVTHLHSPKWIKVLKWLDSDKIDFIHDTGYTKDRDKYLDYSDPIIEMPEVIFVRSDRYDIIGFDSLENKNVGCINKHITHLYLQQFPKIKCIIAPTPMQGVLDLLAKKTDAFIYPKQIVLYLTQNLRLEDKIKITGDELRTLSWSMVVKEGNKEMLSLLNRGLAKVRQSGEYERIYGKWFGQRLLFGYSTRDLVLITITATGVSITTILLIGFFFYNRRMSKSKNQLKMANDELYTEIAGRKKTEIGLQESEARWRSLTETSPDHILTLDANLNIQFANYSFPGLTVTDLIGTPLYQYVEGDKKQAEVKEILESVLKAEEQDSYETMYNIPDGGSIYYESTVVPRKLEGSKEVTGLTVSSRNITERKQAEEKLVKNQYYLTKAQEIGAIGTWELDLQKNVLRWTDENYKIFGVPLGTPLTYEIFLNCVHPEDRGYVDRKWSTALNKEPYDIEHRLIVNDNVKWVREKADVEFDSQGNPLIAIGFTQDITKFKQSEAQIKASLKEKETLLQEIHHRVKNNMQVISSLLKLQSNSYNDDRIKRPLLESQNRVKAMASVHESLYKSKTLSSISVLPFLKRLTSSILASYQLSSENILLEIDVDEIFVSIEQATPIGLIINELVPNSLKYAFSDGCQGKIQIKINRTNNKDICLRFSDDGIGFPLSIDWRSTDTLGLNLVVNLVENQLDGSVNMEIDNGTHFIIIFKEEHN